MIEEFFVAIGIQRTADYVNLTDLVHPFSDWILQQKVTESDFLYLASRVAAFISCYLVDRHSAQIAIKGNRIEVAVPFEHGIVRTLDPYSVAFAVARQQVPLVNVIESLA
jgi:hypothetical protein